MALGKSCGCKVISQKFWNKERKTRNNAKQPNYATVATSMNDAIKFSPASASLLLSQLSPRLVLRKKGLIHLAHLYQQHLRKVSL